MTNSERIKQCPKCQQWFTAKDIMEDPLVVPIGMRYEDESPELCVYYFNHIKVDCLTTFVIQIDKLASLIREPITKQNLAGSVECLQRCSEIEELTLCDRDCHNAPFRELLILMLDRKKRNVVDS